MKMTKSEEADMYRMTIAIGITVLFISALTFLLHTMLSYVIATIGVFLFMTGVIGFWRATNS